jgi:tripartite-type tricarboxylate transporter receptor subunit TctC
MIAEVNARCQHRSIITRRGADKGAKLDINIRVVSVVLCAGVCIVANPVIAQTLRQFPVKPVRLVVPYSPGNAADILARAMGPKMSESWGQPVVVENRPGAGSTLGINAVAKATPDGYTLLFVVSSFVISAALRSDLPYDPIKDFSGVAQIGYPTAVLVVPPALGVKTVKELIALAHERSGKIIFGSAGAGAGSHLNAERFRLAAGFKAVHVGYKGQPEVLVELLGGRVHYAVLNQGVVQPLIKDGRLHALTVLTPQRSPLLPNVPAISEVLPGVNRDESAAMLVPAGTPRAIVHQVGKEVTRILALPDIREKMQSIGYVAAPSTPEECDRIVRAQIESLTKMVKLAGLRAP